MHKYHIADLLTATRFVCAFALLILVLFEVGTLTAQAWQTLFVAFGASSHPITVAFDMVDWQRWLALLLFGIGELTDAFDGIAARHWRYPNDGKKRWWRTHAVVLDQVADILLGVAALAYVTLFCSFMIGVLILVLGMAIGAPVQLWRRHRIRKFGADESQDPLRVRVVLIRRYLYLSAIGVVLLAMTASLPMSIAPRGLLIGVLVVVAVDLIFLKKNRLHEDKTK